MMKMISRRLTEAQKAEILEAYRAGGNTISLAGKYSCSPNTINRTVKTLLTDSEYTLLKKKRSKINNKSEKLSDKETLKKRKEDLEQSNSLVSFKQKVKEEDLNIKVRKESNSSEFEKNPFLSYEDPDYLLEDLSSKNITNVNEDISKNDQSSNNNFEEIAPLISGFDFDLEPQRTNFKILNYEILPESVYMIVDKKVELDLKVISDLPEWSFLPDSELKRNAILLFANQRSAKRICTRNQRVIKIPNTSIFKLSKSYLLEKGITRLILDDSIIGLDE